MEESRKKRGFASIAPKRALWYLFYMTLAGILPYIQIVLSVVVIVCILLQQTGASMGGALGGDNFSAAYHTRRGMEKTLFYATLIAGTLLAASALAALLIN